MKKIVIILLCILCFDKLSSEENKMILRQYELDETYEQDKEIITTYGNLWAIYSLSDTIRINNREETPIKEISFYYLKNNNFYFLGKYNKNGIYDKESELIFKNPFSEQFIGYTESILEDPFYTGQYAYEQKIGPGGFDPFVVTRIDFKRNSIVVTQ